MFPFTPVQVYKYAQDNLPAMLSADDLTETTGVGYFLFPYFFGDASETYRPVPEAALRELLIICKVARDLFMFQYEGGAVTLIRISLAVYKFTRGETFMTHIRLNNVTVMQPIQSPLILMESSVPEDKLREAAAEQLRDAITMGRTRLITHRRCYVRTYNTVLKRLFRSNQLESPGMPCANPVCHQMGSFRLCSGCYTAWYCSQNCQRDDRARHAPTCRIEHLETDGFLPELHDAVATILRQRHNDAAGTP